MGWLHTLPRGPIPSVRAPLLSAPTGHHGGPRGCRVCQGAGQGELREAWVSLLGQEGKPARLRQTCEQTQP